MVSRPNPQSELNSRSWSDIFNDFLSAPPTSSIFRLYLLSFCIWNKWVLLYIFFGSAEMGDKLSLVNWGKFVLFKTLIDFVYWPYFSFYLGPLIVATLIFILVFGFKFKKREIIPSLYYWLYRIHIEAERAKLDDRKDIEKEKGAIIDAEIKNEKSKQVLFSIQEESKSKQQDAKSRLGLNRQDYDEGYRYFKKTSFFQEFNAHYKKVYYDKKNDFRYRDLEIFFTRGLVTFLFVDGCLSYIKTNEIAKIETLNRPHHEQLKFNEKGEYYIKYLEWEKGDL